MSQLESKTLNHKLKLPNKFEVLLLNDDYTSMDFVVDVLRKFFHKEFYLKIVPYTYYNHLERYEFYVQRESSQ